MAIKHSTSGIGARNRRTFAAVIAPLAIGAVLAFSASAFGQDAEAEAQLTGLEAWNQGGCFACHGTVASGGGDAANATGPSLRTTRLDRDGLIEVISCGRPGTAMPAFLEGAYTEHACYDQPAGEVPADAVVTAQFSTENVEALADFLVENVVGVTNVTRETCAVFFEGNPDVPSCLQYPE